MGTSLFVTATGTGIGKTHVACRLIRHLQDSGRIVRALKPVISGFDPVHAGSSDSGRLLSALGKDITPETIAAISPWRFAAPLSPDMAAAREGRTIPVEDVVAFCSEEIESARRDDAVLIVEGVGGVMVPLSGHATVLDWMAALSLPTLLVAGNYLGTISHTLTAVEVMRRRRVPILAVIVSQSDGPGHPPLADTAAAIARHIGNVPVLKLARPPSADQIAPVLRLVTDLGA